VLLEGLAKAWGTNKSQIPEKKVREIEEMRGLLEHNEELRIALKAEIRRLAKQIQHAHQSCERIQHTANATPDQAFVDFKLLPPPETASRVVKPLAVASVATRVTPGFSEFLITRSYIYIYTG
jgi:hypothetical protein